MNDTNKTSNIEGNFVDLDAADLLDDDNEATDRAKRRNPATGARRAGDRMTGKGWLKGPQPPGQPALLYGSDGKTLYMPAGKVGLLAAPGGVGKTTILAQLAVSVASGRAWFGMYPVARPGKVLFVLGEEDEGNIDWLIWRATAAVVSGLTDAERDHVHNAVYANLYTQSVAGLGVAMDGNYHPELLAFLESEGLFSLVILDPASRFFPAEAETDNAAATRFIESLERLTQADGNPTILFAHHTGKGGVNATESSQNDARGSSAIVDGGRWMASLRRHRAVDGMPDRATLEVVKTNYGPAHACDLKRCETGWRAMDAIEAAKDSKQRDLAAAIEAEQAKQRKAAIDEEVKTAANNSTTGNTKTKPVPAWEMGAK